MNLRKYDPGLHPALCHWMSRSGLTQEQIASELGISRVAFGTWLNRHPELRDSMRPGVDFVDALVEGSCLKRALGYDVVETTKERTPVEFEARGSASVPVRWEMKVTKRVTKHIPGDVGAQCFWLKNRKGWKDRVDVAHTGTVTTRQDFSALSDDELRQVVALAEKIEVPVAGRN